MSEYTIAATQPQIAWWERRTCHKTPGCKQQHVSWQVPMEEGCMKLLAMPGLQCLELMPLGFLDCRVSEQIA